MDVEALLFDIGGTVFDWRSAVTGALKDVETEGLRAADPEVFGAEWRKRSLIEVQEIADGTALWRPFDPVLESSLDRTLHQLGIGEITARDRDRLLGAWEAMPAWPEAGDALARLRGAYLLAPMTILSLRIAAFSSRRAGLTWDAIISCDSLGATKPDPESYRRALAALGRPGEKVCFVAAHPSDLRAARAQGMKTAYVVARLQDFGDDYEDRGFSNEFDLVADDFDHLARLMGV
jgi:2-haloacid dehalogenase